VRLGHLPILAGQEADWLSASLIRTPNG
jgi:hypothetical protein